MKKTIYILLSILVLFMSGCSGAPATAESIDAAQSETQMAEMVSQSLTAAAPITEQPSAAGGTAGLSTAYENAVSIGMQLLVGTIRLEGSELAVTAGQVEELLSLWRQFQALSQNLEPERRDAGQEQPGSTPPQPQAFDEEAQAQIEALIERILAGMTPEQIEAIAEMQISQESAMTLMQEKGLTMDAPRQRGGDAPEGREPPSQENMPQGTPPAGWPPGQPPDAESMGAPPADGRQPNGGFISPQWIEVILQLLEEKAG